MTGVTWHVGSQNDGLFIINKPPRPSTDDINPHQDVDVIAKVYDGDDWSETKRRADVLAAAPELLEQLQSLVAILEEGFHRSVTEEARATINKALGITEPSPCSPQ